MRDKHPQHTTSVTEKLLVDGRADLVFNFGVRYVYTAPHLMRTDSHSYSHMNGQRAYPLSVAQNAAVPLIGVRFRPGGLAAFLRLPMVELFNQSIELKLLFGGTIETLEQRLFKGLTTPQEQVDLLDEFFLSRLSIQPAHGLANMLAQRIEADYAGIRIRDLSADFGYSIRSIDRIFRQFFGYSPKFYTRIIRFHEALAQLEKPNIDVSAVAHHCGYYDQSHFIKDFLQFTGNTPQLHYEAIQVQPQQIEPPYRVQFLQYVEMPTR